MDKDLKIDSELKYEFSDGGFSVLVSSESRSVAVMRKILSQLEHKFEGKLQASAPLDNENNIQIIFKEGCIPTGREITQAMSTLETHLTPEEEAKEKAIDEANNVQSNPSRGKNLKKLFLKLSKFVKKWIKLF